MSLVLFTGTRVQDVLIGYWSTSAAMMLSVAHTAADVVQTFVPRLIHTLLHSTPVHPCRGIGSWLVSLLLVIYAVIGSSSNMRWT